MRAGYPQRSATVKKSLWLLGVAVFVGVLLAAIVVPTSGELPWREEVERRDYVALAQLQHRVSFGELEWARSIVDPYNQLAPYLVVSESTARIRMRSGETPVVEVPLRTDAAARVGKRRVVLLDPGHRGGAWSRTESRHFDIGKGGAVREGTITYGTAELLRELLARQGWQVRLSRGAPPQQDFPAGQWLGFDAQREASFWLAEQRYRLGLPAWWVDRRSRAAVWLLRGERDAHAEYDLFELYNRFELGRRAAQAEADGASLTLSLHYNVSPHQDNGIVVFMPGNFLLGELVTASQRYYAIRRILDGSLQQSLEIGRAIGFAMQLELGLPVLGTDLDEPEWGAPRLPVDPQAGLFARNLAILRKSRGAALLIEGPCMNAPLENEELLRREIWVDGRAYPARAFSYARAVAAALTE